MKVGDPFDAPPEMGSQISARRWIAYSDTSSRARRGSDIWLAEASAIPKAQRQRASSSTDGVHGRHAANENRQGRNLRPRSRRNPLQRRGGGGRDRKWNRLWPCLRRLDARYQLAHRMAARIKAGSVWINTYNGFDSASPFGGYKQSGFGRDLGAHALEQYTNVKSVWVGL